MAGCSGRDNDPIIATVPNGLSPLGQRVAKALSPTATFVEVNVELPDRDRVAAEDRAYLVVSRLTEEGVERIAELLQPQPATPMLAGVELDVASRNLRIFWVSEAEYLVAESELVLPKIISSSARRGYFSQELSPIVPVAALAVSSDLVLPSLPSFRNNDDLTSFAATLTRDQTVYIAYIEGLETGE
jgi:hypothetical protein